MLCLFKGVYKSHFYKAAEYPHQVLIVNRHLLIFGFLKGNKSNQLALIVNRYRVVGIPRKPVAIYPTSPSANCEYISLWAERFKDLSVTENISFEQAINLANPRLLSQL